MTLFAATAAPYAGAMVLKLDRREFMRLTGARGTAIEVLDGRVWITETGLAADSFLGPGGRYRVHGDGLVLVGAEAPTHVRVVR